MASTNHESVFTIEKRPDTAKTSGKPKNVRAQLVVSSTNASLLNRAAFWLEMLSDRLAEASDRQIEKMIETALPDIKDPPTPEILLQSRRNAEARMTMLQEFGALTGEQVHDLAGSKARNRFALATRWRQEGRIIGVSHAGKTYYPGFQFKADGLPMEVVSQVVATFGVDSDDWQTALWFILVNGWLGGKRPVDLLVSDPEAVAAAAQQEMADAF